MKPKTVLIDFNPLNEIGIYPNPAKEQMILINGEGKATIYNAFGQAVKHLNIDAHQSTVELADLLNGQYCLHILKKDGTIVTKQFVKLN